MELNDHLRGLSPPPVPAAAADLPLIYIVGAPRSGTTLLSQVLSKALEAGYINNLIARFWARPSIGIRLSATCLGPDARRSIGFSSAHGTTPEIAGPHEFGYFWREWLRLDDAATHHLTAAELARIDRHGLRAALEGEILGAFGLPVLFKNVICGFQAQLLTEIHPRSLFVHVRRDPIATAASILQSRQLRYGSYANWWSLKPAAFDEIQRAPDPATAVALQVVHCRREFDAELAVPGIHALEVDYADLCADAGRQIERVRDAVAGLGCRVEASGAAIEPLRASAGPAIPAAMQQTLDDFFAGRGECV